MISAAACLQFSAIAAEPSAASNAAAARAVSEEGIRRPSPWISRSAVDDVKLERIRGGFTSPDGSLQIAFGIQRSVQIGSNEANSASGSGSSIDNAGRGKVTLIQNGFGNAFASGYSGPAAATVVQNTLGNQAIGVVTTIDVTTNSLQLYQGIRLQSSITTAITASLRR